MSKFESSVKHIAAPQQTVYAMVSDFSNIEKVRDRIPQDKFDNITFDRDTVTVNVPPVGNVTLKIINREEPKCVKFQTEQSPLPFFLWIQVVPEGEQACKMKLTLEADINPFIKQMVKGPLQDGLEKIAEALAMIFR